MLEVVPPWFWFALLLATATTMPAMVRRWRTLRSIRIERPTWFDVFFLIVSRIWLPALAVAVPVVYVIRLLAF